MVLAANYSYLLEDSQLLLKGSGEQEKWLLALHRPHKDHSRNELKIDMGPRFVNNEGHIMLEKHLSYTTLKQIQFLSDICLW